MRHWPFVLVFAAALTAPLPAQTGAGSATPPLVLASQGSFFVGGETRSLGAGGRGAPAGDITVNQINSHMLMQDRNSNQLADLVLQWIDVHVEKTRAK